MMMMTMMMTTTTTTESAVDTTKKHTLAKISRLKDDFERAFRRTQFVLQGRVESLKSKLSPPRHDKSFIRLNRTLSVQFIGSQRTRQSPDNEEPLLDQPDHNFTPSLVFDNLIDGRFSARMPLQDLPSGDVTIRVRNFQLEVIRNRGEHAIDSYDDRHLSTRPYKIGEIDLPIYIDPASLCFTLVKDNTVLLVEANMKGFCGPRLSMSDTDIRDATSDVAHVGASTAPLRRKIYTQNKSATVWHDMSTNFGGGRGAINGSDDDVFRTDAESEPNRRLSHPCESTTATPCGSVVNHHNATSNLLYVTDFKKVK